MDITKMTTYEIVEYLRNERHTAFILWQVNDITIWGNSKKIECTEEEAKDIISELNEEANCDQGITWFHIHQKLCDLNRNRDEQSNT